jgi:hypothetical protein
MHMIEIPEWGISIVRTSEDARFVVPIAETVLARGRFEAGRHDFTSARAGYFPICVTQ